ncbi:MAG: hypothetical protein HKN25_12130 [Pyrinomonadaceae bacterium]|nr:hypothetical protein [Pyrinomonadaceae bacterium]
MMNKAHIIKVLSLTLGTIALVFVSGCFEETFAQTSRDPFTKNPILAKKDRIVRPRSTTKPGSSSTGATKKPVKKGPYVVEAPSAEARINYYKQVRQSAAENGQPIPKPTSVLLLDELSVSGIFKTPRGYAAIVKAKPINLSYTIYPGEKFFDGQLVAVEENRLIFRKITKWSTGKFVSTVENKPLRKYTDQQTFQGTAPVDAYTSAPESADKTASNAAKESDSDSPSKIVSPLEEAKKKESSDAKEAAEADSKDKKGKSKSKKKAKVAKKQ